MYNIKILHITPHLGGGVGSVLLNYLKFELVESPQNIHSIITLDYANEKAIKLCNANHIKIYDKMRNKTNNVLELVKKADIILIHFWNHPLIYEFILTNPLPESRIIFWAHTSGLYPPQSFQEKIVNYPDEFVFTTQISYDSHVIQNNINKNKFSTILSTGGVEKFLSLQQQPHENFNIGYIGTVDYAKMHPDFINICNKIDIPNAKFIVVGGDKEKEILLEVENLGLSNKFQFTGKVLDVKPYLAKFDVFGYPLNPNHYGTAEQVLQEAMAAGIIPIVLNNKAECSLIKHFKNGLIANNTEEYCSYIKLLSQDQKLKNRLSKQCKEYANKNFSLKKLCKQWNNTYKKVLTYPKKTHTYSEKRIWQPHEIFFEAICEYKEPFMLYLEKGIINDKLESFLTQKEWQSKTKGTPKQYYNFMPDKHLERICNLYV